MLLPLDWLPWTCNIRYFNISSPKTRFQQTPKNQIQKETEEITWPTNSIQRRTPSPSSLPTLSSISVQQIKQSLFPTTERSGQSERKCLKSSTKSPSLLSLPPHLPPVPPPPPVFSYNSYTLQATTINANQSLSYIFVRFFSLSYLYYITTWPMLTSKYTSYKY